MGTLALYMNSLGLILTSMFSKLSNVYFLDADPIGTQIIEEILEAFVAFLSGIGEGILAVFNSLVLDESGALTTFAVWGLVFGALAMAWAIFMLVTRMFRRQ